MDKIQGKLSFQINKGWQEIRERQNELKDLLFGEGDVKNHGLLLHKSLQLVLGELLLHKEKYKKFPIKRYSEEDFVDMVIQSFNQETPSLDDVEGNKEYIESIREIMWGHIKSKHIKLWRFLAFLDMESQANITSEQIEMLMDCAVIVFVESIIREREIQLLEHSYL